MKHMPSLPSFPRGKRSLRKLLDSCRSDQNQNRASPSAVSPSPECRRAKKQAPGTDQNDPGKSRRTPSTQAHGAKTVSIEQPAPPPHAVVLQARQELDSVLGRLGDLLEDVPSELLCDESLSLSISLYVDDIRQKSKTLDTVLSAKHISTLKRSEEDINSLPALDNTSVEQPRSCSISHLPTPDFDGSFNIDLRQFSRDESPRQSPGRGNAARSLPPLAHQRHSSSPASRPLAASTPLSVAPLQLPRRSTSLSSFGSRSRASPSSSSSSTSPFCREIHALDAHINASRREGRRSSPSSSTGSSSKPPQCHLRARTLDLGQGSRLLVDAPGCPAPRPLVRRQVSLDDHRALLQRYESTGHRRQFSTEGKAQRLRSLRGAPSSPQLLLRHDDARAGSGQDAAEPLSMDELMGFLREGNSLREL